MSDSSEGFWPRWVRLPRNPWRYFLTATALMVMSYALLYFPYPAGSAPVRFFMWYLETIARVAAAGARLFDPSAISSGDLVQGRFALRIVLDCAALDAHALLACAILAFPVPWRRRAVGVLAGTILLALFNVGRIVCLYVIGLRWPDAFHVAHEEVFQLGIIVVALASFGSWTAWARRPAAS